MMLSFGQAVYLWRLERQLSQAELAAKARMSRPNLSAVEKGKREVTLSTLRALAQALEVTPGTLADGLPPGRRLPDFSRWASDRIARSVVRRTVLKDPRERTAAELLSRLVRSRLAALGVKQVPERRGLRRDRAAWLAVFARTSPATLQSLLQRVTEQAARLTGNPAVGARPSRRIGKPDAPPRDPAGWSVVKLARYLDPDVQDLVDVFRRQRPKAGKLVGLWAKALRKGPRSGALRLFQAQAEHFLRNRGPAVWGKKFEAENEIRRFRKLAAPLGHRSKSSEIKSRV